jgi:hypothetical protein
MPGRIDANQCGRRNIRPLIAQMDGQASIIGLDSAMTEGPEATAKRPMIAVVDDDPAVCGSLKFALELDICAPSQRR